MNIYTNLQDIEYNIKTALTVGTFDGVHLAHREIMNKVTELAENNELRSFVVTFDPHPQEVLKNKTPEIKILTSLEEKLHILENIGIENVLIINFTEKFSRTSPVEFYEKYIIGGIGLSYLVTGYDHTFGSNRVGNLSTLTELGKRYNFNVIQISEIDVDGIPVSSTRIRNLISSGNITDANRLLCYDYSFSAVVIEGDKVGRTIGYPTVNLKPIKPNKVMPDEGIYCVRVRYNDRIYNGMLYHGKRPTLSAGDRKAIEVHLFDFSENIYGETIKVSFLCKLRDDRKFNSTEELINQIDRDKENALKIFRNTGAVINNIQ